jgi:hypothetical protein
MAPSPLLSLASIDQQSKEDLPPIGPARQIVEIASSRQVKGMPGPPENARKPLSRVVARLITVENSVDHACTSQETESLGWKMCATRAKCWQFPAHCRQIVKHSLAKEGFPLPCSSFEPKDRPLTFEREIFGPVLSIV